MRFILDILYKGTHYSGWQRQINANTIQEEIEKALHTIFQQNISVTGSGRTDAGVHALQQVAHFDLDNPLPENILHKLNTLLPRDIHIKQIIEGPDTFHARFDAKWRSYRYKIINWPNPFALDGCCVFKQPLDLDLMNQAAKILLEYEDFQCFSKVKTDVNHFLCTVKSASWSQEGDMIYFDITANRFLRNMVRAIVGTMMDVGQHKTSLEDLKMIIESKNRSKAGKSVPAEGLYLSRVEYNNIKLS